MKIIWNTPSSKTNSDAPTPRIELPKPKGTWMKVPDNTFDDEDVPNTEVASTIHVPDATKRQLQQLSIQEVNLHDDSPAIEATEVIHPCVTEKMVSDLTVCDPETPLNTMVEEPTETIVVSIENTDVSSQREKENTPLDKTIVLPSALLEIEETAAIENTQTIAANSARFQTHQSELRQMAVFCLSIFTVGLLPYTSPAFADYRPWTTNEAPPLIGLWTQQGKMTEDSSGALVMVDDTEVLDDQVDLIDLDMEDIEIDPTELSTGLGVELLAEHLEETEALSAMQQTPAVMSTEDHLEPLEPRSPAQPEKLQVPQGALDNYFTKLSLIEDGTEHVARALVWGDSTIASDGIIKDVRGRMQERFGDAGPGFLAAKVDRRWAFRRDIVRKTEGNWSAKNIVHGGANDSRYGLAGTVSIAHPGARSTLGGIEIDDTRQDLHRFQVFYQKAPNGGDLTLSTQTKTRTLSTSAEHISDSYYELIVPSGDPYVYLEAKNSDVVIYGVALEVDSPGVTWETFGVAGSSISSMQKQHDAHLSNQIAARDPSLLVYWTGGNELGYPSLKSSTGKSYKKYYRKVVRNLKEGAPSASCLLIGPLDQATRENGQIVSKPTLEKLIRFQREVAEEEGCAYWDARAAMGGENAFKEWLSYTPSLASPDLAHLTGRGRKRIGDTLADVLMREYDLWRIANPEVFWTPEESIADPTGDLWHWECENPEVTAYERMMIINEEDVCKL